MPEMIPRVAEARYVQDFVIHLRFTDGAEGDVDLRDELYGELFEPLKDRALFRQFSVHPEFHTRNSCTKKCSSRHDRQTGWHAMREAYRA
jgi:hypothetical protein